jgi:hypothetical protein
VSLAALDEKISATIAREPQKIKPKTNFYDWHVYAASIITQACKAQSDRRMPRTAHAGHRLWRKGVQTIALDCLHDVIELGGVVVKQVEEIALKVGGHRDVHCRR